MGTLQNLLMGLQSAVTAQNILFTFVGGILGLLVGAMPGIGSVAGTALLLPLTYSMNPTSAIIMLAAIYYGNMFGGAFSSILINIPGDASAAMTCLDGYPLAKKGNPGKALLTSMTASFVGGAIGAVLLTVLGPLAAKMGLKFGPAELSLLLLLAMTSIGWMIGDDPMKGLLATAFGIAIGVIGTNPTTGMPRLNFGSIHFTVGIQMLPLVIGMFGFEQVIEMVAEREKFEGGDAIQKISIKKSLFTKEDVKTLAPVVPRSGLLGFVIGILPGAGALVATLLSYATEKKLNKHPEKLGTGAIEGIAAPEAANNAASMGAFAPMLALGVPGSTTAAVLMAGLMLWGLQPGPLLFTNQPEFVWSLIGSMYVGDLICLIVALASIPLMMRIVKVPKGILAPVIVCICVLGAYCANNRMIDIYIMIVAGLFGYCMHLADISTTPMLLAFVLCPMFERYVRRAFDISNGSLRIFVGSPICIVLIVCILVLTLGPSVKKAVAKRKLS